MTQLHCKKCNQNITVDESKEVTGCHICVEGKDVAVKRCFKNTL